MGTKQMATINLHNPQVYEMTVHTTGTLVLELSNDGAMAGCVDMFFDDDAQFHAFIQSARAAYESRRPSHDLADADGKK